MSLGGLWFCFVMLTEVYATSLTPLLTLDKMVTVNDDKWIFLLAMCFMCVSSHENCQGTDGKIQRLNTAVGSSVVLPCNFGVFDESLVTWTHNTTENLIHLSPKGRIKFVDHRYGRLKAFPNQGSEGNYSISIDQLKKSDFGCYRCCQRSFCLQVDLSLFEQKSWQEKGCKIQRLKATVGSSVVLPCNFGVVDRNWVTWTHNTTENLIRLSPEGRIKFLDHRYGRVKAFPNQGSEGNYSICIDQLKKSDFGYYRCNQGPFCLQVDLSLFEQKSWQEKGCKIQRLKATVGSSVVLPCNFGVVDRNWVTWTHNTTENLIHLSPEGRIKFLDHRYGRVKAFPNQGSEGNYSISIDQLKKSDFGHYRCNQGRFCLQVDLSLFGKSAVSEEMWLLIYISVCVAVVVLLCACSYLCWMKCLVSCDKKEEDNANISVIPIGFHAASAPPVEQVRVPVQEQQIENDFQSPAITHYGVPGVLPHAGMSRPGQSTGGLYPDLNQITIERVESRRTRQRFHIELISRIRQASLGRHYYVNRDEINRQQARAAQAQSNPRGLKKKKAKDNCEYKNPIYNRSTEYLNQL
ncbi:uncharacterized protein LOC125014052 isoform X2 [Mugil cephalus]|uniref:uncharacterized protein LOC125014052 isoform X2 n=1 Tax=Mugil cephalus TaxID=48193 RepID=UPI001FB7EF12|nr:uncharacterized protein LOC125014052 isoform X2 [Mugil cephalus]